MKAVFRLSILLLGGVSNVISGQSVTDPIYLKVGEGWQGLYGHGNQYAEFQVRSDNAQLQDAYHVLLQDGVGMMVSFCR